MTFESGRNSTSRFSSSSSGAAPIWRSAITALAVRSKQGSRARSRGWAHEVCAVDRTDWRGLMTRVEVAV